MKLERLAGEFAGNLSYGQQKLVEFIRVLMTDPGLILLDEPAAGVNRTLLNDLLDAVRALRDQDKTVLLVEHDMKVVMGLCETVFVLDHGEKLAEEFAGNLSYGQQKLVEFVRMLMTDPELILLDEPAAGVNRTLLNELLDAVRALRDQGKTVLLVEHDMKVVMGLCETVLVLDHGEKLAEGAPGVIQADERVIEAYFGR